MTFDNVARLTPCALRTPLGRGQASKGRSVRGNRYIMLSTGCGQLTKSVYNYV